MSSKINIAIDGPAASGKSAAAQLLAKEIDYIFVDTGIIYRSFTLFCLANNFNLQDQTLLLSALNTFEIKWTNNHFLFNNQPITDEIYSSTVTKSVPIIAAIPEIRAEFVKKIQEIVSPKGYIVVGRDITSVVLPDAELKVFLTSSLQARSIRRWKQYLSEGIDITQDRVYQDMLNRDQGDENRNVGQLTIVSDAIVLDNSDYDLQTTVKKLLEIFLKYREEH
ncbi:(d)CMP kinase [Spiroplasma platyhelix]|uniref:Cytidylate kinase n=1 Tax=Spiroplasma platyhelix PALS-1 TaxID=1276218 RepID=A0A846U8V6_9MOLU|nr:(d)CMP kinase [Spiroplasma platyhelix]MBE4703940.1 Cytidylate kinase [Spiroplasma platyhelix PALS-1]NKE38313.1 (d)CMP kinase [Spiroplasma platyhelix PALS-1]UJB29198.1 cytidylate kinase [Spiroplasma platyhelix PALS-1]